MFNRLQFPEYDLRDKNLIILAKQIYNTINFELSQRLTRTNIRKRKLKITYFCRHFNRKSFAPTERWSGIGGWDFVVPIWKRAATWRSILLVCVHRAPQTKFQTSYFRIPLGTAGSKEAFQWPSQSQYSQHSIYQQSWKNIIVLIYFLLISKDTTSSKEFIQTLTYNNLRKRRGKQGPKHHIMYKKPLTKIPKVETLTKNLCTTQVPPLLNNLVAYNDSSASYCTAPENYKDLCNFVEAPAVTLFYT